MTNIARFLNVDLFYFCLKRLFCLVMASLVLVGCDDDSSDMITPEKFLFKSPQQTPLERYFLQQEKKKYSEEERKERAAKRRAFVEAKRCDGEMTIEISGYRLRMSRERTTYLVMSNGLKTNFFDSPLVDNPIHNCELDNVRNVRSAMHGIVTLTSKDMNCEGCSIYERTILRKSEYLQRQKRIDYGQGVISYITPGTEYFVVPQNLIPSADNAPVTITCANTEEINRGHCSAGYFFKPSLVISYRFAKNEENNPIEIFLNADKERRDYFKRLQDAAKQHDLTKGEAP